MTVLNLLSGSYSSQKDQGIKLWGFDTNTGKLELVTGISGIERPSFLAIHPERQVFAAGSEDFNGNVVSYEFSLSARKIIEQSRRGGNGDHPAHVCIDRSGKWLLSVNYSGGNVNVFEFRRDNKIGALTESVQHEGSGPNGERQDSAHPHSIIQVPGKDLFAVSDLGADTIYLYQLDGEKGELALVQAVRTEPGTGPRHLVFHPDLPLFYSLGELDSTVTVYSFDHETIQKGESLPSVPAAYEGENTAAEIAISEDGKTLYASNRGHDSIVSYKVDEEGKLYNPEFTSSGGNGPRHFTLVPGGDWLIVANEKSNSLTVLKLEEGRPMSLVEEKQTDSPVCVKFIT